MQMAVALQFTSNTYNADISQSVEDFPTNQLVGTIMFLLIYLFIFNANSARRKNSCNLKLQMSCFSTVNVIFIL
jgi:hypothetical protein